MSTTFVPIEPFQPAWWASNPHVQTMLANSTRPRTGINFQRERLETPDGDFVDLDFAHVDGYHELWSDNDAPIVLAIHGLEGNARRGYMCELYKQLAAHGIRAVGLNFRTCSGEMNRTTRMYHSGATYDVELTVNWLSERFPNAPLGLAGFSLGANVTLKYMGENGDGVKTAVSISPPFDLATGSRTLEKGFSQIYAIRILKSLKRKAEAKAPQIEQLIDMEKVMNARTFFQFDDAWAPLYGFRDATDYYQQCSSQNFLAGIRQPTLILRALDDPFFSSNDVPTELISQNPNLQAAFTKHGGHVAFIEGTRKNNYRYWAERQGARFLAEMLKR